MSQLPEAKQRTLTEAIHESRTGFVSVELDLPDRLSVVSFVLARVSEEECIMLYRPGELTWHILTDSPTE